MRNLTVNAKPLVLIAIAFIVGACGIVTETAGKAAESAAQKIEEVVTTADEPEGPSGDETPPDEPALPDPTPPPKKVRSTTSSKTPNKTLQTKPTKSFFCPLRKSHYVNSTLHHRRPSSTLPTSRHSGPMLLTNSTSPTNRSTTIGCFPAV